MYRLILWRSLVFCLLLLSLWICVGYVAVKIIELVFGVDLP